MVKMHHMIVHELRGDHEIADELRVGGDGIFQGIFDGAHRGEPVDQRTHPADTLRKGPGIAWIAALQNDFDAAHHGAGARRLGDGRAVELRLDPQMPFDARDGIDDDGLCGHGRSAAARRLLATSSSRLWVVLSQLK